MFYKVCIDAALKKRYLKEEGKIVFSRGAKFKDNAISVGAAAMVIENIFNKKNLE